MQFRLSQSFLKALFATLMTLSLGICTDSWCTPVETHWPKPLFHLTANNTNLGTVLKKFAKAEGLHLQVANGVQGRVTGKFDLPPEKLLDLLADQYNFSWRLDGKKLAIAPLATQAKSFQSTDSSSSAGLALRGTSSTPLPAITTPAGPVDPALTPLKVWSTTPADKTLQNALARWAIAAGWQLFWELPQDYSVEAAASINGSFEDAITAVTNSLQQNDVPVSAVFFEGNRVLRIVAKGAQ